jgi:CheY-like chemotaxis protein
MKKGIILHLEDDDEWVKIIHKLLEIDYEVHSARSYKQAKAKFVEISKDDPKILLIVDISLEPGEPEAKHGFDFLQLLQELELTDHLKIIVLSGRPSIAVDQRVAFVDYYAKDVFDKAKFVEEEERFLTKVAESFTNDDNKP